MNIKVKILSISLVSVVLAGVGIGGFYFGKIKGREAARKEFKTMLDMAFPPPPQEIKMLSGVVEKIIGGTIKFIVDDPADYLPHVDKTPRVKQKRLVDVMSNTEYSLIDFKNVDANGNPTVSKISFSDIKPGDTVTISSNENIMDLKNFNATKVEVTRY